MGTLVKRHLAQSLGVTPAQVQVFTLHALRALSSFAFCNCLSLEKGAANLSATHTVDCAISQVYHVTVMPCFDKKLEAARPELLSDGILCALPYCIACGTR